MRENTDPGCDRLKYAFSLLQMALEHAQHPEQSAPTLKQERLACGIDDTDLDAAVAGAREAGDAGRTAVLAAGAPFYLATGQVQSADDEACRADLDFLGSRLVFLIDWNRARKQLRGFLRAADRLALLSWAAEAQIGHRGFLELGGATVVNRAIEATAGSSMRFGDRLCDVLGDAETIAFLRFVFRAATDGVLAAQSHALIQDRVRVALAGHFRNEERQLLGRAAEHAGLVFELAGLVRDGVRDDHGHAARRARRAKRFEHEADQIVADTREAVRRRPDYAVFLPLLEAADAAADALEDAAFLLQLTPLEGRALAALQDLADVLAPASQEWIKALGHAGQIGRTSDAAETEDFLAAVARIGALEHEADDAERILAAEAVKHAPDFRQLHLFAAVGGKVEAAADALNAGGASGAGVGFTRDPATGVRDLYFDFQFDGQGEDVVAGRQKLEDRDRLRRVLPVVWTRLEEICRVLETLFGDAQDFEFTVQSGVLCLLQARRAKRTDWAALVIAADMVAEGLLTPTAALAQIRDIDLGHVVRTSFIQPVPRTLAIAQAASLGVACGALALDTAAVERLILAGTPAILVRQDTVTSDIEGMARAAGILTGSGGRTSHAAVVARQLGKVCLVACPGLRIDLARRQCRIGTTLLDEGDLLALDGNTGAVHAGKLDVATERPEAALKAIASWQIATAA